MKTVQSLQVGGFLSFAPGSEPLELHDLNVLIGPNGSGKSNLIEVFEILHALPTDLPAALRRGGGAGDWLWKGEGDASPAIIEVLMSKGSADGGSLGYRLEFAPEQDRPRIAHEEVSGPSASSDDDFHYRYLRGRPIIRRESPGNPPVSERQRVKLQDILPDQSILAQRKDPDLYPEVAWLDRTFSSIQTFREWTFSDRASVRRPQPTDSPRHQLLPDARNLAPVLDEILHRDERRFMEDLKRLVPQVTHVSTVVSGGTIQFHVHEIGHDAPVPPTRMSDGTLRILALLAAIHCQSRPSVLCLEGPELGLHPDAVAMLARMLREASAHIQMIVTTHSDAFLSALSSQPESVITCEKLGTNTVLRRLDPAELAKWLSEYTLGDIWCMGQLGANP